MKLTPDQPANRRVTLEDLARAAGISRSAASKAMRDHPAISKATRRRVQPFARDMGYVRDPALSRLAHYRWNSAPAGRGEPVAYLFPVHVAPGQRQPVCDILERVFSSEGFDFQAFHTCEHTPAQLRRMLRARGICGGHLSQGVRPGRGARAVRGQLRLRGHRRGAGHPALRTHPARRS